jgi:hypothetical protein
MLLAACGPAREPSAPALPKQAARWTLDSDAHPVADRVGAATTAWRWTFSGTPSMRLTGYAMPSETSAFDALQKWRAEPGKLAFYYGRYFYLAESPGAGFKDLNEFRTALAPAKPQ